MDEPGKPEPSPGSPVGQGNGGLAVGLSVGSTLVAGVGLGVAAGYGLDLWLGSRPWGLIGCFLLGVAAGMYLVFRRFSEMTAQHTDPVGGRTPAARSDDWDED